MTLEEIKAFLAENKDDQGVKDYLAGLAKPTPESVKAYLDTDEGKRLIQPSIDQAVTRGIESWKQNNLDKLVEQMHNEKYPPEDEKDKQLREIQSELAQMRTEKLRESLKSAAIKKAVEKGLPVDVIDRFIGDDETMTAANIDLFESTFKKAVEAEVEKRFKSAGGEPGKSNGEPNKSEINPWLKKHKNLTLQGQITRDDPEKAKRMKAEAEKANAEN